MKRMQNIDLRVYRTHPEPALAAMQEVAFSTILSTKHSHMFLQSK